MHPDCPFCPERLADSRAVVLENEHCLFLQQPHKVLIGSGFIIPRNHREQVFDLDQEEWASTYPLLQEAKQLLETRHNPNGYTVGWNNGAIAGQSIFHVHLHIIPRYADEPYAGRGFRSWIKRDENLRPSLKP